MMKQINDMYRFAMITPAMIGLGLIVLYGIFIFSLDNNKNNEGDENDN